MLRESEVGVAELDHEVFDVEEGLEEVERVLVVGEVCEEEEESSAESLLELVEFLVGVVQEIEELDHDGVVVLELVEGLLALDHDAEDGDDEAEYLLLGVVEEHLLDFGDAVLDHLGILDCLVVAEHQVVHHPEEGDDHVAWGLDCQVAVLVLCDGYLFGLVGDLETEGVDEGEEV